jgi:glyoxylase-like metal-dependent hydrolase (beta-lactamase superfamily II)
MKRRTFVHTTSLTLAALPSIRILGHQLGLTNFEMEILRGNVGYFSERGGTIGWLMEDDGIVVVDTQFPEQAGHFIEELQKESQAPIEYLINTHHHQDHTSGNIAFKDPRTGKLKVMKTNLLLRA